MFTTLPNTLGNADKITDFNVADDTIKLENAVFGALGAPGALAAAKFQIGAHAAAADDRIIYNKATGALMYDAQRQRRRRRNGVRQVVGQSHTDRGGFRGHLTVGNSNHCVRKRGGCYCALARGEGAIWHHTFLIAARIRFW